MKPPGAGVCRPPWSEGEINRRQAGWILLQDESVRDTLEVMRGGGRGERRR